MSEPHSKFKLIRAPQPYPTTQPIVFLSGTIHYSSATDWRGHVSSSLSHLPITVLNPHRADWDSSWKEDIKFQPFKDQVNWELAGMEAADMLAVYFGTNTEAPITLMELGLAAREKGKKCVVACVDGYKKKGNVQVVCERYAIEVVSNEEELGKAVLVKLKELGVEGA
ncbi:uncharacterized protein LY89DRAFT_590951 [Mollisia scopiformis]|uniref:Nucleoside 2-deoxyribosyltransferase domain-containing protein n=1 Tax=Mollisia scopiformis TaxID=149040 RepID=A0A194X1B5_MOLSC|nr:uncharacterized protein LY89DRAFT_590951 [Mollisia scopiformis]KUJ13647.1 hypothetical protein LY89DRAFT_590951 [Mollisia scopiformis]